MDIYVDEKGNYRLVEGDQTIKLDVPNVLSLLQTVLDDEYANLDLNIDEVLLERQEEYEVEQLKYVELDDHEVLHAFNKNMKVFSNFVDPVYKAFEEIDLNQYFDKKSEPYYTFFCLKEEEPKLFE